ncbi:MAG: anthranilate synthase component I family protein, partial [bacterium]
AGEDLVLQAELLLSEKERAEHVMLVDLERNDLGRVCRPGSVRVAQKMVLESYSHVSHIVSEVRGRLRPGVDALRALAAVFPGGTITGCPKVRAMEIIDELERVPRGPYTGSLGYLSLDGTADWNILIRSLVTAAGRAHGWAGAGIVADSDSAMEYRECRAKAEAMVEALGIASDILSP